MLSGGPDNSLAQFSKKLITWWKKDIGCGWEKNRLQMECYLHNSHPLSGPASSDLIDREWPPFTENFWTIARQWLNSAWLPQGWNKS